VQEEHLAVFPLEPHYRRDGGTRRERVEDSRYGHSLKGADNTEPTARETTSALDQPWPADLYALDFAVRHPSTSLPSPGHADGDPVV
jgi:hypothetical protein